MPGPGNNFFFEVISERPVSEHLEEGVMVDILSNVVEIIMLSSGTNTLLSVDGSFQLGAVTVWIGDTKEQRFELKVFSF